MIKRLLVALAFMSSVSMLQAAPVSLPIVEGFDNVAGLAAKGWLNFNASNPGFPAWGQGDADAEFPAHSLPPDSYAASSFQSGVNGELDNYLITPEFSTVNGAVATFYLRASFFPGFSDKVQFGFIDGNADLLNLTLSQTVDPVPTSDWVFFTITLDPGSAGSTARLAFRHFGATADSNYVGLDTLRIDSLVAPVPEPASILILGIGIAGLSLARRRR